MSSRRDGESHHLFDRLDPDQPVRDGRERMPTGPVIDGPCVHTGHPPRFTYETAFFHFALLFFLAQFQRQRLSGAGLIPDIARRKGFSQSKSRGLRRCRRIENFCFVVGGYLFGTHQPCSGLSPVATAPGTDSRSCRLLPAYCFLLSAYLSLGITSLPLLNSSRTSRSGDADKISKPYARRCSSCSFCTSVNSGR